MKNKELTWKDIKLAQAIELFDLKQEDYEDELDFYIQQLSILEDKDPADIENMTPAEIIETLKKYQFIKELPKEKLIKTFKYNKKRFGMMELDKLSLAQMVDIEEYVNAGLRNNIHKIMSVLFLPIKQYNYFTKQYILEEYKPDIDRENMMLDLDMEFVYSNLLFFYHIVNVYTTNIQDSLITKVEMEMKTLKSQLEIEDQ